MQSKTSTFFKVLINRFHPGINPAYFKSLPPDEIKEAYAAATSSPDTTLATSWTTHLISRTHYSWLAPYIQALPDNLKGAVINALPENQSNGIKKLLNIKIPQYHLTPNMKAFLLGLLYQQWKPEDALPPQYLPQSFLESLNDLSKNELIDIIDLLAIYDLAEAVRHIVDKKNLKAIYLCLPHEKQKFLRTCLHKKERFAASKLDISKWDGSQEQLCNILHRRGLLRFGKALCGQNRHFVWNITHTLDTGRGKTISAYYNEDPIPGVTNLLIQQVITVINFLKPKSDA